MPIPYLVIGKNLKWVTLETLEETQNSSHLIITGHGLFQLLDKSSAFPHSHERDGLVHFQMSSCQLSVEINAKIMETWGDVVCDRLVLGRFCTASMIRSYHAWIILLSVTVFTLPHWLVSYAAQSAHICAGRSALMPFLCKDYFQLSDISTLIEDFWGKNINQTNKSQLLLSPSGFYGTLVYLKIW